MALALKGIADSRFVMTEHSSQILNTNYLPSWVKNLAPRIYRNYDKVIGVSPFLVEKMNKNFNANAVYIPNMYDDKTFFGRGRKKKNENSSFMFVFVGNLIKSKNPILCIEAFCKAFADSNFMTPNGGKIILSIVGDGPELRTCEATIDRLNMRRNVRLLGVLQRTQISEIMQDSKCFVLPSQYETFGVVYIEAMACGLPVIATRCGGPDSFINESNGRLIPVDDETALVSAFKHMLENAEYYDSVKIAQTTAALFSPNSVARAMIKLYKNLSFQQPKNLAPSKGKGQ